ncbi:hypothetical protein [Clostridium sp.]|jgi:hypothetical protein|uniref:hypothetical protein n=1 Tax=Clostridium sp. TaxID=1506 RepID=UPI003EEAD6AC
MIKVLSNEHIEINSGEMVQELILSERKFFMEFITTYRYVHGTIFVYKNKRYKCVSLSVKNKISSFFKLNPE